MGRGRGEDWLGKLASGEPAARHVATSGRPGPPERGGRGQETLAKRAVPERRGQETLAERATSDRPNGGVGSRYRHRFCRGIGRCIASRVY
jgi:hypothetical protein